MSWEYLVFVFAYQVVLSVLATVRRTANASTAATTPNKTSVPSEKHRTEHVTLVKRNAYCIYPTVKNKSELYVCDVHAIFLIHNDILSS